MKIFHKFISIILCLTLVLAFSTSFAFGVDWSTTDQTNLSNIASRLTYGSYSAAGWLSRIYSYIDQYMPTYNGQTLTNNNLSDIKNMLGFTGTVDLSSALSLMNDHLSNIDSALTGSSGSGMAAILESILNELISTSAGGAVTHFINGIYTYTNGIYTRVGSILNTSLPNIRSDLATIHTDNSSIISNTSNIYTKANSIDTFLKTNYTEKLFPIWAGTGDNNIASYDFSVSGSWIDFLNNGIRLNAYNTFWGFHKLLVQGFSGYNANRSLLSWTDLTTSTFTPTSATNGIYTYLAGIQNPLARLAYVHASDEEIAARQKAEANQTAVVNNFIDPNGSGSLPTSSIGSVSDMSDSFKDNFSTDASPTGLFDIFNSDHGSWFSQETADQLDTTNINNRSLKAAPSDDFDTPLLDQQIEEIYNALGVKK